MKEAIKLAIEKGAYRPEQYRQHHYYHTGKEKYYPFQTSSASILFAEILLDSLFWQALGKACMLDSNLHDRWWAQRFCPDNKPGCLVMHYRALWKERAREYFDLILTGGDTEKFWKELTAVSN